MTSITEDNAMRDDGEIIATFMKTLDQVADYSEEQRAAVLLAVAAVVLRDLAQLSDEYATPSLGTVRELASEYLGRLA